MQGQQKQEHPGIFFINDDDEIEALHLGSNFNYFQYISIAIILSTHHVFMDGNRKWTFYPICLGRK